MERWTLRIKGQTVQSFMHSRCYSHFITQRATALVRSADTQARGPSARRPVFCYHPRDYFPMPTSTPPLSPSLRPARCPTIRDHADCRSWFSIGAACRVPRVQYLRYDRYLLGKLGAALEAAFADGYIRYLWAWQTIPSVLSCLY